MSEVRWSEIFVAVRVDGPPARITGVYRAGLDRFHLSDRYERVRAAATEAAKVLRAPPGTSTVLALEPVSRSIDLPLQNGWSGRLLPVATDDQLVKALTGAELNPIRFDAIPAAVARFSLASIEHWGRLTAGGWTVRISPDRLRARAVTNRSAGPADFNGEPEALLAEVAVPRSVQRWLHAGYDAAAIGAALRSHGHDPDLIVEPFTRLTPAAQWSGNQPNATVRP